MQILQIIGVPVAGNPNFMLGSLLSFRGHRPSERLQKWTKQYGRTYGYYEGPRATLVSSDLDFLQEVFVKQFGAFNSRKMYSIQEDPDGELVHMFTAQNERWKRLRQCANPAFSTAKMKQMFPAVRTCEERFMRNILQQVKERDDFNIYDFFQRFTLDVIFECGFGVRINAQEDANNIFLVKIREAFDFMEVPVMMIIAIVFWEVRRLVKIIYGILLQLGLAYNPFVDIIFNLIPRIVRMRQEQAQSRDKENCEKDLIQLMLDALHSDEKDKDRAKDNDGAHSGTRVSNSNSKSKAMSLKEVEAQVELFMLAGYETSSTALAYCTYLLATHPDVQKRLQQEIDEFYAAAATSDREKLEDDIVNYDGLIGSNALPYLDMVVHETLRMYPIAANVVSRMCVQDTEIRGMKIPAGVNVVADVWSVHYDPEIWGPEDPRHFYPERFQSEVHESRHPLAFLAFGAGPRNCIGMRFAMMEIKLILVRLLRHYDIEESDRTEKPLQLREMEVVTPKNGVHVRVRKREGYQNQTTCDRITTEN